MDEMFDSTTSDPNFFDPSSPTNSVDLYFNHSLPDRGDIIIHNRVVQAAFSIVYCFIFVLGLFGNILVCYVVGRNKTMQTVTNLFITNLALSDILLLSLAVPFTPIYTFIQEWIFGKALCHLVLYAQGTSVYISTLTLTSIAIDRFRLIISPFKPRMKQETCFYIITGIWLFSLLATLPYGIFLSHEIHVSDQGESTDPPKWVCQEAWPSEGIRQIFSWCTAVTQFIFPFAIISFCYVRVSLKLSSRAKFKPGSKNSKKEELEKERKRRTNRMLIAMVAFFGFSWLPLNLVNLLNDLYEGVGEWTYYNLCFFIAHAVAMTSTCYNPFLYAWLNENFRKEFKQVLAGPCCQPEKNQSVTRSRRFLSERTCNGNETIQESFLGAATSPVQAASAGKSGIKPPAAILDTIEEQTSNSHVVSRVSVNFEDETAHFSAQNQVQVHIQFNNERNEVTKDMGQETNAFY